MDSIPPAGSAPPHDLTKHLAWALRWAQQALISKQCREATPLMRAINEALNRCQRECCPERTGGHNPDFDSMALVVGDNKERYFDVPCKSCGRTGTLRILKSTGPITKEEVSWL